MNSKQTWRWSWAALCLLLAIDQDIAHAQTIYRNTSSSGQITFSDIPVATANKTTPWTSVKPDAPASTLPPALLQAVSRFPAVLYTTQACAPCDSARSLLLGRGIVFTEKTVQSNEDIEALRQISGSNQLPMLSLGSQQLQGFSEPTWQQYLTAAGYPENNALGSNYRQPPALPLASKKAPVLPTPLIEQQPRVEIPAAIPGTGIPNPAGIRF